MSNAEDLEKRLRKRVRDVPDFPRPGVRFKDITPVLTDVDLFKDIIDYLGRHYINNDIDVVAGIESRGFIFAAPLALHLAVPFVPFRKLGKLPGKTLKVTYALEYGSDALEAHADVLTQGQRVLVVDDVLATGGTLEASGRLVESLGGVVAGFFVLLEIGFLAGRQKLGDSPVHSLVTY